MDSTTYVSLLAGDNNSDQKTKQMEKQGKRGNEAPPLQVETLGVHDQKTQLTAIQFVIVLGICPNLFSGFGFVVESRSGFAAALIIHCSIERKTFL